MKMRSLSAVALLLLGSCQRRGRSGRLLRTAACGTSRGRASGFFRVLESGHEDAAGSGAHGTGAHRIPCSWTIPGRLNFRRGNYGGLIPTPAAQAAIKKWNPRDQLKPENACRAPSIVYALQGPFPIEIFQSDVFIVMKLEYYDLVRLIFLDGRKPEADFPHSMTGFSSGHWEGSTLVVETTHLEAATLTNNGLDHTENIKVTERFRLSPDGKVLMATQEYEDPAVIQNRGVRFIAWRRQAGQHVYPYECDPGFAGNYKAAK